jgi:hypothetical protein
MERKKQEYKSIDEYIRCFPEHVQNILASTQLQVVSMHSKASCRSTKIQ